MDEVVVIDYIKSKIIYYSMYTSLLKHKIHGVKLKLAI